MDFLKKWWIWLLLAGIMLSMFLFDLFAISGYRKMAAAQGMTLKTQMDDLLQTSRNLTAVPTKKDIATCSDHIARIRQEGLSTVQEWNKASLALSKKHGRTQTNGFQFFLSDLDIKLGRDLANQLGTTEQDNDTPVFHPKWITSLSTYSLVSTDKNFSTMAEIEPYWKKYLIKKVLHTICGDTKVPISMRVFVRGEGDAAGTWQPKTVLATLDRLSDITIGDVVKATHNIDGTRKDHKEPTDGAVETDIVYYDSYAFSFKVVAHPRVLDAFMSNLLNAPKYGILLSPKKLTIKTYTLSETQEPGGEAARSPSSYYDSTDRIPETVVVDRTRSYDHEPPVEATLEYTIYHFDIPETAAQPAENTPAG